MGRNLLTQNDIDTIMELHKDGVSMYEISKQTGRAETTVKKVIARGGGSPVECGCPLEHREPTPQEEAEIELRKLEVQRRPSFKQRGLYGNGRPREPMIIPEAVFFGKRLRGSI